MKTLMNVRSQSTCNFVCYWIHSLVACDKHTVWNEWSCSHIQERALCSSLTMIFDDGKHLHMFLNTICRIKNMCDKSFVCNFLLPVINSIKCKVPRGFSVGTFWIMYGNTPFVNINIHNSDKKKNVCQLLSIKKLWINFEWYN